MGYIKKNVKDIQKCFFLFTEEAILPDLKMMHLQFQRCYKLDFLN